MDYSRDFLRDSFWNYSRYYSKESYKDYTICFFSKVFLRDCLRDLSGGGRFCLISGEIYMEIAEGILGGIFEGRKRILREFSGGIH